MTRMTLGELQTEIEVLKAKAEARDRVISELVETVKSSDEKLTKLLSLKDQGRGVLWLLSIIWASGIIGGVSTLWHWLRG